MVCVCSVFSLLERGNNSLPQPLNTRVLLLFSYRAADPGPQLLQPDLPHGGDHPGAAGGSAAHRGAPGPQGGVWPGGECPWGWGGWGGWICRSRAGSACPGLDLLVPGLPVPVLGLALPHFRAGCAPFQGCLCPFQDWLCLCPIQWNGVTAKSVAAYFCLIKGSQTSFSPWKRCSLGRFRRTPVAPGDVGSLVSLAQPRQGIVPSLGLLTGPGCPQVRLLTGIGRYNDMTYIFELLHQKHYFEVLMRKNLDPVGEGQTCRELCGCSRNCSLLRVKFSGYFIFLVQEWRVRFHRNKLMLRLILILVKPFFPN